MEFKRNNSASLDMISSREAELESFFTKVGVQFGSFLALLHSTDTLDVIGSRFGHHSNFPESSIHDSSGAGYISQLKARLQLFAPLVAKLGVTSQQLFDRAMHDFSRETGEQERALAHGDAFLNLLVAPDPHEDNSIPLTSCVDWEHARIWRGVSGDFPITAAGFATMEIAAAYRSETMACAASTRALRCIRKLRCALVLQYRETSCQRGSSWIGAISEPSDPRAYIVRSAMIVHGTEMIRHAVYRRWKCGHTNCSMDGDKLEPRKADCELLQMMMRCGIWYLYGAGDDLSQFRRPDNWKRLQAGRREGLWLLDLFL